MDVRGFPVRLSSRVRGGLGQPRSTRSRFGAWSFRALVEKDCSSESSRVAGAAGLEPVTSAVTGQRSNQLSYAPAKGGGT